MTCPSADVLCRFLELRLSAAEEEAVSRHVEDCPGCQEQLDGLVAVNEPELPVPADKEPLPQAVVSSLHALAAAVAEAHPEAPAWLAERQLATPSVPPTIRVPGYELLGQVGRGGMAVVFHARHEKLNREVALKIVGGLDPDNPQRLARFRAEGEAVARLQHPHIVQVYDIGETDGYPYLALEYLPGGTLAARLQGTPQPPREAARMVHTLALAVQHAHERGIIHRDLKPANVLLDAAGSLKISDFGLAKQLATEQTHTRTGEVVGTPSYMAPEQLDARQGPLGPGVDVWALGAILYAMLTGRPPFRGESVLDTLEQVRTREPLPPTLLQPGVPRDLETICLACLHKEPNRRYLSAQALADDLRRFLRGRPILARPVTPWQRAVLWARRQPVLAALLGAVLLLTLTVLVSMGWAWRAAHERAEEADRRVAAERAQARSEKQAYEREHELRRIAELSVHEPRILLAEREWQANNLENARALLEQCRPRPGEADLRGWEWFYLDRLCRGGVHVLPQRWPVTALAFSPDERWLLVGTGAAVEGSHPEPHGEVKLWDARNGREHVTLLTADEPSDSIVEVGWSPDGRWASAFQALPPTWHVWEVADPKCHHQLAASGVSFLPDGQTLAVVGRDGGLTHVELASGKTVRTLRPPLELLAPTRLRVAFDPTGQVFAMRPEAGLLAQVHVVDARTGEERLALATTAGWLGLALDPERKTLINGDRALHVAGGELRYLLKERHEVRFSLDGSWFARGWYHDEVHLHDAATGELRHKLSARPAKTYGFQPHPRLPLCATGQGDGLVQLWQSASGEVDRSYRGHRTAVSALAFAPRGEQLASGGSDRTVHLWDSSQDQRARVFTRSNAPAAALAVLAEVPHPASASRLAITSPDGSRQARLDPDKDSVTLWSATGLHKHVLATKRAPQALAFSPDNRRLAILEVGNVVSLWDVETGHEVFVLAVPGSFSVPEQRLDGTIAFSGDGRRLMAQLSSSHIVLWTTD